MVEYTLFNFEIFCFSLYLAISVGIVKAATIPIIASVISTSASVNPEDASRGGGRRGEPV